MSTNNKTKLGLNQWNGNDIIEYTDHIADNMIIDTEIRSINDTLSDEIFVDGLNGSDVNDGKTSNTAFKTISKAISQLSHIVSTVSGNGLKIKIANGTYDEDVVIRYKGGESIDLIGNISDKTAVKVRSIKFDGCVNRRISANCIEAITTSMDAFQAINCLNYSFTNCTAQTATQIYDGFSVSVGSGAIVNCVASNRASAIVCKTAGIMTISQNSGSNNIVGVQAFNGAIITHDGTTPDGTTKLLQNGGTIFAEHPATLTANDILTLLKTVDGTGSGLDADLFDGKESTAFFQQTNYGAILNKSTSATLVLADANSVVIMGGSSAQTITIPTNTSVPFPVGTQITFIMGGAGAVVFAPGSGVTLQSKDTKRTIDGQYASATLVKIATDTWSLIGALKA